MMFWRKKWTDPRQCDATIDDVKEAGRAQKCAHAKLEAILAMLPTPLDLSGRIPEDHKKI